MFIPPSCIYISKHRAEETKDLCVRVYVEREQANYSFSGSTSRRASYNL